jgi:hypothetical protein
MEPTKQSEVRMCGVCGVLLTTENRVANPSRLRCKSCVREYYKAYYATHTEQYHTRYIQGKERRRSSNPYRYWAQHSLANHRKKGFDVQIAVSQLEALAKASPNCGICECLFNWSDRTCQGHMDGPSVDRINNGQILSLDTIQIVCGQCNMTKGNLPMRDFVHYCKRITDKWSRRNETE